MGLLDDIQENERQKNAGDELFWKNLVMFFELRVPASLSLSAPFFFPMVVPPESYSLDEEFGVEVTNTQMGGLYAEETGIVRRMINLGGTTGFNVKGVRGGYGRTPLLVKLPEDRTWGRDLLAVNLHKLSGQRHFHYLQDAVFRTYGDLVRDPALALETQLLFHNLKDEESWVVSPKSFRLTRTKGERFLYRYDIQLLILGKAAAATPKLSADASILNDLKAPARSVRDAISMAQGALNEVVAVGAELETVIADYVGIVGGVSSVVDAAQDFANGVTDLINIPYTVVTQTIDLIDNALVTALEVEEAGQAASTLPLHTVMKFRTLADSLELLGVSPEHFRQPLDDAIANLRLEENPYAGLSDTQVQTATQAVTPTTLGEVRDLGTSATTGDVAAVRAKARTGQEVRRYTGGVYQAVRSGDTLVSLAARYLGDGRLWVYIAAANGLQPPFLTDQAGADLTRADSPFRGAISTGDQILIPDFSRPPEQMPDVPVLGSRPEAPSDVRIMGRDFRVSRVSGSAGSSIYGVTVDTEGGSSDAQIVQGIDNLAQTLLFEVRTELGTDQLYPLVGLAGIIGTKNAAVDLQMAKLRVSEVLARDSRVLAVRNVVLVADGDMTAIEASIEPRGWDSGERVRLVP